MTASDRYGSRITTDILVAGHTTHCMKQYTLDIPDEIIRLLFMFWFVPYSDEWDRSLIDERVNID